MKIRVVRYLQGLDFGHGKSGQQRKRNKRLGEKVIRNDAKRLILLNLNGACNYGNYGHPY